MSSKSKQAERNAQKRAAKKDQREEEPVQSSGGVATPAKLMEVAKNIFMDSCIVKFAPKMQHILQAEGPLSGDVKAAEKGTEEETTETDETTSTGVESEETYEIFTKLVARLAWHSPLGLDATPEDSMAMWLALAGQPIDWGPLPKKRGTPKMDRILTNLTNNLSKYLQVFLGLMMLQAFLFRSFFACLPWLVAYQFASVVIPLKTTEMLPQVPLSQIPLKFRVAGTMGLHALVWLFFAYEAIWRCNFFIEFLALGLIVFHAHSSTPSSSSK